MIIFLVKQEFVGDGSVGRCNPLLPPDMELQRFAQKRKTELEGLMEKLAIGRFRCDGTDVLRTKRPGKNTI
jgi:hypothetical protein